MTKKQREPLTDAQLLLMGILWEKGRATVHQVRDSLPKNRPLAYTTVMTTLRYLEWKGYIRHDIDDRTYVYFPVVPREEVVQSTLCHIADRVFHGSAELLMATFLQKQKLSAEKLRKLKQLIAAKEKEAKK